MDKLTEQDLVQINTLARKELTAEEVYTFPVRLCDNEGLRAVQPEVPGDSGRVVCWQKRAL